MNRMEIISQYKKPIISAINKTLDSLYDTRDLKEIQSLNFDTIESCARAYERLREKIGKDLELSNFEFAELTIILSSVASYLETMGNNYLSSSKILNTIQEQFINTND